MKTFVTLAAAIVALGLASPAIAASSAQDTAAEQAAETEEAKDEDASAVIEIPAITAPEPRPSESVEETEAEEEVICRSIRLDMSSRRKTRVCRTEEGWRELNQQR